MTEKNGSKKAIEPQPVSLATDDVLSWLLGVNHALKGIVAMNETLIPVPSCVDEVNVGCSLAEPEDFWYAQQQARGLLFSFVR